jgi:hypothetical protein
LRGWSTRESAAGGVIGAQRRMQLWRMHKPYPRSVTLSRIIFLSVSTSQSVQTEIAFELVHSCALPATLPPMHREMKILDVNDVPRDRFAHK